MTFSGPVTQPSIKELLTPLHILNLTDENFLEVESVSRVFQLEAGAAR